MRLLTICSIIAIAMSPVIAHASLPATLIIEVENGGADTNGGAFDPTGGTMDAAGAISSATGASPVLSSANYTFVSGDVGAWAFIRSGTNSIPGWYQIASVAGGNATLNASIGSSPLYLNNVPNGINTVAGCGTAASLTSITWSVDYSQRSASVATGTATSATTTLTATSGIFTKSMVGNTVTNGTNWTTITAFTSSTIVTIDTAVGWTSQSITVGGAFASPGRAASICIASCAVFVKYNASAYSITSASANIAGGTFSPAVTIFEISGYSTNRHVANTDLSMPTLQASGISTCTIVGGASTGGVVRNLIVDGQSLTSIRGFTTQIGTIYHCIAKNCTNSAFNVGSGSFQQTEGCLAIGCTTQPAFVGTSGLAFNCAAINCTGVTGFNLINANACIAAGCAIGFNANATGFNTQCSAYGNSSDGFVVANGNLGRISNSLSYGNTGKGFNGTGRSGWSLQNCAAGGDTGTDIDTAFFSATGSKILTASPFVNGGVTPNTIEDVWAAFLLNSTAGAGASCKGGSITPYRDLGAIQTPKISTYATAG